MIEVTAGELSGGLPYLRLGAGPPLLVAVGLSARNANPAGLGRRVAVAAAAPFARHFTVYVANRRPGLPEGATMSDLAAGYATAIEQDLGGPALAVPDPGDMLVTIAAEDVFDAEPHLGQVQAPTLVLGGGGDPFYSEDLFRRTAAGVPHGQAVVFPRRGHVYAASSRRAADLALGFLLAA